MELKHRQYKKCIDNTFLRVFFQALPQIASSVEDVSKPKGIVTP